MVIVLAKVPGGMTHPPGGVVGVDVGGVVVGVMVGVDVVVGSGSQGAALMPLRAMARKNRFGIIVDNILCRKRI